MVVTARDHAGSPLCALEPAHRHAVPSLPDSAPHSRCVSSTAEKNRTTAAGYTAAFGLDHGEPSGFSRPSTYRGCARPPLAQGHVGPVVTWWLCAGGRVGPVVHMCAGKARRFLAFAVPMWARGKLLERAYCPLGPCESEAAGADDFFGALGRPDGFLPGWSMPNSLRSASVHPRRRALP